ncbi:MAG: electron transfer flavoprotein subunit beta/FixA family protein [Cyanobacteria bacterium NC_groundwater_1444_Ag_S-0.65um_54_12]|nr:electron transfer flavoprotein subunit beta/FixA family protein [Cyanobacteria bacterium NC_groundwater_1444_Ag_S-0.65um_54_12]
MKIVVCVKYVPDTNEPKRLKSDLALQRNGVQSVINPMDEYALEIALKWKDADPALEVVTLTMGPEEAKGVIKKCLAKGADRAVLLQDPALGGSDALSTSRTLAAAIAKIGKVDAVLCGIRSSDGDCNVVGPAIAELLDWPQLTYCKEAQLDQAARYVQVQREADGALEIVRAALPVLLTVTKCAFEPRLATFKGITAANKKELLVWSLADLNLSANQVGWEGATVKVMSFSEPPPRPAGQVLSGSPAEVARKMVEYLHTLKLV